MYSDEWINLGYSSDKQTKVSDCVFYRFWRDKAGTEIGVTVDFETAYDYHYEMPISDWRRFQKGVLGVNNSDEISEAFRDYFTKNDGPYDFESHLRIFGIGYQKIFF
jgi:hypothetical protein